MNQPHIRRFYIYRKKPTAKTTYLFCALGLNIEGRTLTIRDAIELFADAPQFEGDVTLGRRNADFVESLKEERIPNSLNLPLCAMRCGSYFTDVNGDMYGLDACCTWDDLCYLAGCRADVTMPELALRLAVHGRETVWKRGNSLWNFVYRDMNKLAGQEWALEFEVWDSDTLGEPKWIAGGIPRLMGGREYKW